jgi:hypothetical protein
MPVARNIWQPARAVSLACATLNYAEGVDPEHGSFGQRAGAAACKTEQGLLFASFRPAACSAGRSSKELGRLAGVRLGDFARPKKKI